LETHKFDNVDYSYGFNSQNEDIYAELIRPLIENTLQSGLSTVMAYGQTSAGKTYTMSAMLDIIALDLFKLLPPQCQIAISYLELVGDKITDVLSGKTNPAPVNVRAGAGTHPVMIQGLSHLKVSSASEFHSTIQFASGKRRTRCTLRNNISSRSHAICIIRIVRHSETELENEDISDIYIEGRTLLIVDLAGSERHSDQEFHSTERMKETQHTNASLMALKECIRAYHMSTATNETGSQSTMQRIVVPYRASKLTTLLRGIFQKPSSDVPTKTVVIGHLAPAISDSFHSLNTARWISTLRASAREDCQSSQVRIFSDRASNSNSTSKHPSKWTYRQLCRKISTWSHSTINLAQILPYYETGPCTLGELSDASLKGSLGRQPIWLELYRTPLPEWIKSCSAFGVTSETATRVWEEYRKAVAAGRSQASVAAETMGVLLV
jgi:kinesin family protein 2/24